MSHTVGPVEAQLDGDIAERVGYREFKLLLHPERLAEADAIGAYARHLDKVARRLGIAFDRLHHPEPQFREVVFYDTPRFRFYEEGFILRKRTFLKNGRKRPDFELTIRFRHRDAATAAALDMRPLLPCLNSLKFKQQILPENTRPGGLRLLYATGCELDSPNVILTQRARIIAQVFPALQRVRSANPEAELAVVNGRVVEERLVHLGELTFGPKTACMASIAVWRDQANGADMIGEFGYQLKFDGLASLRPKARALSETLFREIQTEAPDWLALGTTKTALVYGDGRPHTPHHE